MSTTLKARSIHVSLPDKAIRCDRHVKLQFPTAGETSQRMEMGQDQTVTTFNLWLAFLMMS